VSSKHIYQRISNKPRDKWGGDSLAMAFG